MARLCAGHSHNACILSQQKQQLRLDQEKAASEKHRRELGRQGSSPRLVSDPLSTSCRLMLRGCCFRRRHLGLGDLRASARGQGTLEVCWMQERGSRAGEGTGACPVT